MAKKAGTMLIKVHYLLDEEDHVARIDHPNLIGSLGFEFSTLGLAEIQIQALREDKPKSQVEDFLDDTHELMDLVDNFKSVLKS